MSRAAAHHRNACPTYSILQTGLRRDDEHYCLLFLQSVRELKEARPLKVIAYMLMPDHFHIIINPGDGRITDLAGALKALSVRRIIDASPPGSFLLDKPASDEATHQVWQESFKALPLWSNWLIWQKINYIHLRRRVSVSHPFGCESGS